MSHTDSRHDDRPLTDVTVLELGHIAAGPYCSLLLADLGADVIKVERRASGGDSVRDSSPVGNSLFNAVNRNKRAITLDLKTDGGLDAFYDLVGEADVFVENLRPGAPEGLGIGYEDLVERNPGLVYCSIKGFNEGPYEEYPALDPIAEALSGLMSVTGHPDRPPARAGTSVADMTAALFGAIGVVSGLRQRELTGEGQHVTAPLYESTVSLMGYWLAYAQAYDTVPDPIGAGHQNWAPYNVYRTADEQWVFVGPSSESQWERLCDVLGTDLPARERFETLADRREHKSALDAELQTLIGDLAADALVEGLRDVGVPVAPVQNLREVCADDHLRASGGLATIETTEGAEADVAVPTSPLQSSAFDPPEPSKPPELGEDTDAVLAELGYDAEEIDRLRESGCL